jgi:hypothetical protein
MIKATLKIAGKEYNASGKTIDEALQAIPITWMDIKGKGVMTVSNGKQTIEKIFYLKQMRRMFGNKLGKIFRTTWANRFELQLREQNENI